MATGTEQDPDLGSVDVRPGLGARRAVLVLLVIVLAASGVALWWDSSRESSVETTPAVTPVRLAVGDLLGEVDMQAAWPGPWAVLRTGEPQTFERPLVGCTRTVSPVDDPVSALARWSIHAPPQSDGPALSEVLAAARTEERAGAAVERVRSWITECEMPVPGPPGGTRETAVVRDLPDVQGFLAEVRTSNPDVETYEQIAVGRVGTVVVLLSYGQYGPPGLGQGKPEYDPLLTALDRAVDKLG